MYIIVKFILRNINEKKLRTFLIIFSIIMSTALFFSSTAITDTITKMYSDKLKKSFGESEIIMTGKNQNSKYFKSSLLKSVGADNIQGTLGVLDGIGLYKIKNNGIVSDNVTIVIKGTDWDEQQKINPVSLLKQYKFSPFKGKKIILSNKTAQKYNLKEGSNIDLEINGEKYKFNISGIAAPVGPFTDDGQTNMAIVPKDVLGSIYEQKGSISTLYIKIKNSLEKQNTINILKNQLKRFSIRDTISKADLEEQTAGIQTALTLIVVIVLFMSAFIIYTSFKVITMERLPVIGTFRSIGASKKLTNTIMYIESISYGIVGGIIGNILGIGILYIIANFMKPSWSSGYDVSVNFTAEQIIISFLLAVFLSFFSALVPILNLAKIPIKEIVLNTIENTKMKKRSSPKIALGCLFILLILTIPRFFSGDIGIAFDTLCLILSVAAIVLLVPYLTKIFVKLFEHAYAYIFGNEGVLAAKNLRDNENIINNISLLAIGIASLLMINTVTHQTLNEIINYFDKCMKFDVYFYSSNMDRSQQYLVNNVDGAVKTSGFYELKEVEVKGKNQSIGIIEGIDKSEYLDFTSLEYSEKNPKKLMEELDSGRNIIMCTMVKKILGVNKGDTLTLRLGNTERKYKVIGFINSMMNGGNYAIISSRYFKADTGAQYYDYLAVKTNKNPTEVLNKIRKKFIRNESGGITMNEVKYYVVNQNQQLFTIMSCFSVMTIIISFFGVLNNLIISFIKRKRSLAILRSVGMSKHQIIKMIFIESMTGGLIGGLVGVASGILMTWVVSFVLVEYSIYIPISFSSTVIIFSILVGILVKVAASVSPSLKSSKMNIITMLKYE